MVKFFKLIVHEKEIHLCGSCVALAAVAGGITGKVNKNPNII